MRQQPYQNLPELTEREFEILALVADDHSTKQIALHLGISEFTVKNHRAAIIGKLNAVTPAGMVANAFRLGILK